MHFSTLNGKQQLFVLESSRIDMLLKMKFSAPNHIESVDCRSGSESSFCLRFNEGFESGQVLG